MLHRLLKVQSEENPGMEVFRKVFRANTSENAQQWGIHSQGSQRIQIVVQLVNDTVIGTAQSSSGNPIYSDSEESSKRILNQVIKVCDSYSITSYTV